MNTAINEQIVCFHCGEDCNAGVIPIKDKMFCCEGCKMVYLLLNENGMCQYYALNSRPGLTQRKRSIYDKFAFLEDSKMISHLISFKDDNETHVTFYLPQVHCSSCLWLLENLRRLHDGVIRSEVDFPRKEIHIVFRHKELSLKEIAGLLVSVGYEPHISLRQNNDNTHPLNREMIARLGVAAFCFANIMLLSFAEYLGLENGDRLQSVFRIISLVLAIPVLLYCSQPFFSTAWKGIRNRFIHIDMPVAFAILVTFIRSIYEVTAGQGSGYFDSMSGIVFFMLAGRVLQDRTWQQLSFTRDYEDYFPLAASIVRDEKEVPIMLPDIKCGDTLRIHNEELIPVDGILTRGRAFIDYSFVTGEASPVMIEMGEIIYAGGKQSGANIELLVIKEVAQSYLTSLWNRDDLVKDDEGGKRSFVHSVSAWFGSVVLVIAIMAGIYWKINDPARTWNAVTAVLIVACPCALLLTGSLANGNVLRIMARNKLYLRNAGVIERITRIDHIVFDKTGTLTSLQQQNIHYAGEHLSDRMQASIHALTTHSNHPLSKALMNYLESFDHSLEVHAYSEDIGYGIKGLVNGSLVKLGSEAFVTGTNDPGKSGTSVYVSIGNEITGCFTFSNPYREDVRPLMQRLYNKFRLSVLSGDNSGELAILEDLTDGRAKLLFNRKPVEKLEYIAGLQREGAEVMMIGDGLNDAGALCKSDVGISVTGLSNNFTPASDAIMEAAQLPMLSSFIKLCRLNKVVIISTFIFSILYNLIGLVFAVSGTLSPVIAAILMPASSLSILVITFGATSMIAHYLKL